MSNILNNTTGLQEILEALQNKAAGGEQATPEISVDTSTGLITATAGTKSSTKQLAFQPAKTITPTTTSQIAVSSGYYTGGNITVAAVPTQTKTATPTSTTQNITPDSGKFLSKVTVAAIPSTYVKPSGTKTITANGTYDVKSYVSATVNVEGGEADYSTEDSLITRTFSSYTNDRVTSIGSYAFASCSKLISVNFPNCSYIGSNAFNGCSSLTNISFPNCTNIGSYAFRNCSNLTSVNFPNCSYIGSFAFRDCSSLTNISFPNCSYIGSYAFGRCSSLNNICFGFGISNANTMIRTYIYASAFASCKNLTNLTLYYPSVATLSNINAFASTPMSISTLTGSFGSIYVPASLVNAYKSATNWATYADRITAIQEDTDGDSGGDETQAELISISATYSGGDVTVGTAFSSLSGIMVTAHYSDGSLETVTDYTLSNGTIVQGNNTVTVTYNGKTTTFSVNGVASVAPPKK